MAAIMREEYDIKELNPRKNQYTKALKMMSRAAGLSALFFFLIGVLSGCGVLLEKEYKEDFSLRVVKSGVEILLTEVLPGGSPLAEKAYEENVSLRIVKSGVRIEEVRFDEDLGVDGKQIYKFTIPIEITGTFQNDCTIPVYYYFDMERNASELNKEASAWATEGQFKRVFEGKLKIERGTTGIVYYEGETDDALMNSDSTPYEQAWVAFQYDDGFIDDNYAGIFNPFFDEEKYPISKEAQNRLDKVRDIEPQKVNGNVYVDEDSIKVEKTYVGEEAGNPQHYTLCVTIRNDSDNLVSTKDLWIGCDYDMASPFNSHNCFQALDSALTFMDGFGTCLGYTVQRKSIKKSDDSIKVEFDMYNRYAGYSDSLMGNDLDWYQCFWIAICLEDDNVNDNYVIVPNPYFNEEHYSDEDFWLEHPSNDIYRYTTTNAWNDLFEEQE